MSTITEPKYNVKDDSSFEELAKKVTEKLGPEFGISTTNLLETQTVGEDDKKLDFTQINPPLKEGLIKIQEEALKEEQATTDKTKKHQLATARGIIEKLTDILKNISSVFTKYVVPILRIFDKCLEIGARFLDKDSPTAKALTSVRKFISPFISHEAEEKKIQMSPVDQKKADVSKEGVKMVEHLIKNVSVTFKNKVTAPATPVNGKISPSKQPAPAR